LDQTSFNFNFSSPSSISARISDLSSAVGPSPPYCSIVLTGKNDNYGGGFLDRAQTFLNRLSESLEKEPLADIELVYVDYATASEVKKLHQIFTIPASLRGRTRFLIVPPEFHEEKKREYSSPLPFLEYVAKNIGIRRSRGEFVLAMNPDSLLPDTFFELVARRAFNDGVFYTATRLMMEENDSEPIEFAKINEPASSVYFRFCFLTDNKTSFGYEYVPGLGDFTMLSKRLWEAVGGYDILGTNHFLDHTLKAKMFKLVSSGFAVNLPSPILHQYHVHLSSHRPHSSMEFVNATLDDYIRYGRLLQLNGVPDQPFWGWPGITFSEVAV
jgi:hypothetical protein